MITRALLLAALWMTATAWGAEDGEITLDVTTLTAVGTALGTVVAAAAGALWRFWPAAKSAEPPAPSAPTVPASTLPPQAVPTKTSIIRQVKAEELQRRLADLLPKLERVDWDALDDLGPRLARDFEHLERLIERANKADRGTD